MPLLLPTGSHATLGPSYVRLEVLADEWPPTIPVLVTVFLPPPATQPAPPMPLLFQPGDEAIVVCAQEVRKPIVEDLPHIIWDAWMADGGKSRSQDSVFPMPIQLGIPCVPVIGEQGHQGVGHLHF